MSEVQNIVIIGASIAGHTLANALVPSLPTSHRILIVDASDFTYWPLGGLRAAVVPGWEDRVTVPLTTSRFFQSNSLHQVIAPNKVIELKKNSVVLEHPFEGSNEVPFFKCILATGAIQPSPMRAPLGISEVDMKASLKKMQAEIGQAKKIVIIGGGPVGLEIAGEIRDASPSSEITVIHSQSRVLNPSSDPNPAGKTELWSAPSTYPKLSTALESELKALNINVILGDKVETPVDQANAEDWDGSFGGQAGLKTLHLKSGKTVQADYIFVSIGNKPASGLVEQADAGAVQGGMVKVDEYLRVSSSNTASPLVGNYYAIGDVCNTPGWKTAQGAGADAAYAATAILADVKGTKAKKYARGTFHALIVPIGKTKGAGFLTVPVLGSIMAPKFALGFKAKNLLIDQSWIPLYKGSEKVTIKL